MQFPLAGINYELNKNHITFYSEVHVYKGGSHQRFSAAPEWINNRANSVFPTGYLNGLRHLNVILFHPVQVLKIH